MISLINGTLSSSTKVRGGNKFCKISVVIKSHLKLQVAMKSTIPAHERPNLASFDDNNCSCSKIKKIIVYDNIKQMNKYLKILMITYQFENNCK